MKLFGDDSLLWLSAEKNASFPKSTWQSIIGAALSSFHKLLLVKKLGPSETSIFLHLAKRHKSSLQVLSAVAEYSDSVFRYFFLFLHIISLVSSDYCMSSF